MRHTSGARKYTRACKNPALLKPGRHTGIHETDLFSEFDCHAKRPKFCKSSRSVTRNLGWHKGVGVGVGVGTRG